MREKLIKLLKNSPQLNVTYHTVTFEEAADWLLANAVIVLPCKVGDTVYGKDRKWTGTVEEIVINSDGIALYVSSGGHAFYAYPAVEELTFSVAALRKEDEG